MFTPTSIFRKTLLKSFHNSVFQLIHGLLDCFFPPHCCCCDQPSGGEADNGFLCERCSNILRSSRLKPPFCSVCGRPLSAGVEGEKTACLKCRVQRPFFDTGRSVFPYRGPAGEVVKVFKYNDQPYLGALLLNKAIRNGWFPEKVFLSADAVVPVPLYWRKRHQRGFNQAELIAKTVAVRINKPLNTGLLVRTRHTDTQARLAARQRVDNVKGAFETRGVVPENVLLVDDVMTTGATANECAKVLKKNGAEKVDAFTIVRATI